MTGSSVDDSAKIKRPDLPRRVDDTAKPTDFSFGVCIWNLASSLTIIRLLESQTNRISLASRQTLFSKRNPMLKLLWLFASFGTQSVAATPPEWSNPVHQTTATVPVVDEIKRKAVADDFSLDSGVPSGVAALLPSHCWDAVITLLGNPDSIPAAASFCANLSMEWQKRLALELARCHLADVDRPLFRDATVERTCASQQLVEPTTIQFCVRHLTDAGEHAYSYYIPYIQTLCTRKTQELFIQYQQEKQEEMAHQYADIAGRSVKELESLQRSSSQYVEEMTSKLSEIPLLVEEQVSQRLQDTLREELGQKLQGRIEAILQTQSSEQYSFFEEVMTSLKDRETENKAQYEEWAFYQSTLMLQQAKEMERQRDSLKQHRTEMEELSKKVLDTSENMQPLVGLQSLMKSVTNGYAWISFLLYFLATFNVIWVFTRPSMCKRFRSYLFGVILAEAALEIALTLAVSYQFIEEDDRVQFVYDLRRLAIFLECITYVVGLIISFASPQQFKSRDEYEGSIEPFYPVHYGLEPEDIVYQEPYEQWHRRAYPEVHHVARGPNQHRLRYQPPPQSSFRRYVPVDPNKHHNYQPVHGTGRSAFVPPPANYDHEPFFEDIDQVPQEETTPQRTLGTAESIFDQTPRGDRRPAPTTRRSVTQDEEPATGTRTGVRVHERRRVSLPQDSRRRHVATHLQRQTDATQSPQLPTKRSATADVSSESEPPTKKVARSKF